MKLSKYLFVVVAALTFGVLTSCGETTSSTETTTTTTTSNDTVETSLPTWVDYVNDPKIRLGVDYHKEGSATESRDFTVDGIAQVGLHMCIDGDTAHFTNPYNTVNVNGNLSNIVKIRFYGIDTPESTGKIQPYGKQASDYTKSILKNAANNGTIVITGTNFASYKVPTFDSTGTRYLGLVWVNETVKNAAYNDLKLLNLQIVEYGYSWVKSTSDIPELSSTFVLAETQAETYKLKLHSGEKDPYFNYEGAQEVEILKIKEAVVDTMTTGAENAFNGANIKVYGVIVGYANNTLYIQKYYSEAKGSLISGGEYASLNIFTGMSTIPSKFQKIGNLLCLVGTFEYTENFGMQVSGVAMPTKPVGESDSYIVTDQAEIKAHFEKTEPYVFEDTMDNFSSTVPYNGTPDLKYLYSPIKVTDELVCTKANKSASSGDIYLTVSPVGTTTKENLEIYISYIFYPDQENHPALQWKDESNFLNQTFKVSGIFNCRYASSTSKYYYSITCRPSLTPEDLICTSYAG